LEHTQGLAGRAYERQGRWPERLASLRQHPEYEQAFAGEPLVSIRIGTYDNAEGLCERALASVRAQTYEHWEAVVVGDATEDDTEERIGSLGDPRIRFWNLPFRAPMPDDPESRYMLTGVAPFNAAADATTGSWIAPIDDDDYWEDDHIEVLLRAAQEEHAELAYGRMRVLLEGSQGATEFGAWPPQAGDFGFQAAIYHGRLAAMLYDANSHLVGEPADWNLARRMLEAGVCFEFVERVVTAYFVNRDEAGFGGWKARQEEQGSFAVGEG
jgi:glycosyltransferase involved in cell wall biosynthesis